MTTDRSARVQCHLVHCIPRMQCYIQFPFLDLNLLPTFLRLLKIISKNSDQFRTARQCYSRTQGQSRFRVYPGKLPVERKDAKGHSNRWQKIAWFREQPVTSTIATENESSSQSRLVAYLTYLRKMSHSQKRKIPPAVGLLIQIRQSRQ